MNKIFLWISILCLPFSLVAQQSPKPSDFHGVLTVDENKDIDFTSLNNPSDGTNIAFYKNKPSKEEYLKKEGRNLLSFSKILSIEILPLTSGEVAEFMDISGDLTLQKASLTLMTPDHNIPEIVYLDFKWFEWRSDIMKGFPDTYRMEVRNVAHVQFKH